ncbi:alpha/beta hydrolase [Cystobacter fuscus]|uniref:alpha/beta hydrolase n=1 Tax=Cystobacter fuscus TaxID=43 RepID=UPI0037BE4BB2
MSEEIQIDVGDYKITGRKTAASRAVDRDRPPLIIALHGGGFTSAYFDCGGYSLFDRASAAGCPSLGIDRPGYGASSRLPEGDRAVPRNAELLQAVISQAWHKREYDASGVVLIGHSIGSGIALYIASQATDWPLLGVSFSGLAVSAPSHIPPFWNDRGPHEWIHTPSEFRMGLMFGPPGTHPPGAPELSDSVSKPVWWREIVEMYTLWPEEFSDVCSRVRVPVHYRQGDHDALWANGQHELDRFARAFTHAPSVDAGFVSNSGHCIDFHLAGKAFHEEQIAFAIDCSARLESGAAQ